MFKKVLISGFAKGASAIVSLLMTFAIGKFLNIEDAGYFFWFLSIFSFLIVFCRMGWDNYIIKEYSDPGKNSNLIFSAILTTFLFSSLTSLVVYLVTLVFLDQEYPALMFFLISVPFVSASFIYSFYCISRSRLIISTFFQNFGYVSLFLVFFAVLFVFDFLSLYSTSSVFMLSSIFVFIILVIFGLSFNGSFTGWELSNIKTPLLYLWPASVMSQLVTWSSVILSGFILMPDDVAQLTLAQRISQFLSFILLVFNAVAAPGIARLWRDGKKDELYAFSKKITRLMVIVSLPVMLFLFLFSNDLMMYVGSDYANADVLLMIYCFGQFVNISTGMVGYLLTLTGHEKDFRNIVLVLGPLSLIFSLFCMSFFGVLGAAISSAASIALQNLFALWVVRKKIGFWNI
jgi:O-antigen/teichoic acid export membrane protein